MACTWYWWLIILYKINEIFYILSALRDLITSVVSGKWYFLKIILCYILLRRWQRLYSVSDPQLRYFAHHFHFQPTWFVKKNSPVHPCCKKVENCSPVLSAVRPRSGQGLSVRRFLLQCVVLICILVALLGCVHEDLCKLRQLSHLLGKIRLPAIFRVFWVGHQLLSVFAWTYSMLL
jgi:hypothetical protein